MPMPNGSRVEPARHTRALQWGALILIAAASAALAGSSQRGLGMLWDEKVDLDIAAAYLDNPLYGSGADGSQTRLPMMVNAVVLAVTGPSLQASRMVSIAVGLATILATFGLARRLFDGWTALLAAAVVGLTPYFLAFSRIAMTEGDVFPALFVTLACWAYVSYADRRNGPRLAMLGVAIGLAIGAKLYALFLIPVFGLCEVVAGRVSGDVYSGDRQTTGIVVTSTLEIVTVTVCSLIGMACSVVFAQYGRTNAAFGAWSGLLIGAIAAVVALLTNRDWRPPRLTGWALASALGLIIACAAMPQHLLHPDILRTIARRTVHWDHVIPGSLLFDHLRLYAGVLLVFATPPIGLAAVGGIVWAWIREGDRPELRMPVFAVTFFVLGLTVLPLRQTFYLMNVWPLIAILTAAGLIAARRWLARRSRTAGVAWSVGLVLIVGQLVAADLFAWPDYSLYPRRWIGTRWLGAEARGYRNLVQTPCDGYAELIQWCIRNVQPHDRVVSYLWADHILDELLPADPPFTLIRRGVYQAADQGLPPPPPPDFAHADYLLLHVNNRVEYRDAPTDAALAQHFTPALVVYRDRDMPIAWIYRRRPPTTRGK